MVTFFLTLKEKLARLKVKSILMCVCMLETKQSDHPTPTT